MKGNRKKRGKAEMRDRREENREGRGKDPKHRTRLEMKLKIATMYNSKTGRQ